MNATATVVEVLRRDVHPAEVASPNGEILKGRVFVTSRRLLVYAAQPVDSSSRREIRCVLDVALTPPEQVDGDMSTLSRNARLECRTADGTYWINRGRGCGCGSPLLSMRLPVSWSPNRNRAAV